MPKRKVQIDLGEEVTKGVTVEDEPSLPMERQGSGKQIIQRAVKKSSDAAAMLKAVVEAHSPAEMTFLLREAMTIARARKDWYGILMILRFQVEYGVGKPVQRSVSAQMSIEQFAAQFEDDPDPLQEDGAVI